MMTDTQILEFAEKYLDVFPDDITSTKEQLLKFAREIYEEGREGGYNDGVYMMMELRRMKPELGEPTND